MKKEIELLKDNHLLNKVNELIDILYQEKYNLILTDYTDDLTEYSVNNMETWNESGGGWDNV